MTCGEKHLQLSTKRATLSVVPGMRPAPQRGSQLITFSSFGCFNMEMTCQLHTVPGKGLANCPQAWNRGMVLRRATGGMCGSQSIH